MTAVTRDVLLQAVAQFLARDVAPTVTDRGLGFRLRIAAHLLGTIAAETKVARALDQDELEGLRALLPDAEASGEATRLPGELEALNGRLARALREGELDGEARDRARQHLMNTLRARLAVTSPTFDLSNEIET